MFPFFGMLHGQIPPGSIVLVNQTITQSDEYPTVSSIYSGIKFYPNGVASALRNNAIHSIPFVQNWLQPQPQPSDIGDR